MNKNYVLFLKTNLVASSRVVFFYTEKMGLLRQQN